MTRRGSRRTCTGERRVLRPVPAAVPGTMIEDLARCARVSGRGRLLDLACGTGQLAFPLRRWFAEVWAVDPEPDMVEMVRAKAAAAGDGMSGRSCRAPRLFTPLRTTSSWPSSATRSTGSTATWSPAGSRLARAGRAPGAVLVVLGLGWRGRLAVQRSPPLGPVEGGARCRAPDSGGLGSGPAELPDPQVLSGAGLEPAGCLRSPSSIAGPCRTSPGSSGRRRSFRSRYSATGRPPSTPGRGCWPARRRRRLHRTVNFAYELSRKPA